MSSDNNKCFQCQEASHMACFCPHIRCLIAIIMAMLQQIAPTRYLLPGMSTRCRDNTSSRQNRSASRKSHTRCSHHDLRDKHRFSPIHNPTHTTPDIEVTVKVIPTEAVLDHSIDLHAIAPHITEVPACTATAMTFHTADPHHDNTSPERTVDPEHIGLAGNIINQHKDHLPVHKQCLGKTRTEGMTGHNWWPSLRIL